MEVPTKSDPEEKEESEEEEEGSDESGSDSRLKLFKIYHPDKMYYSRMFHTLKKRSSLLSFVTLVNNVLARQFGIG